MPSRSEILDTLAASQEKVTAYFQGLSPEELERPCTASAVPGEAAWRAKDHFAHLAENERNIQILLRLTLNGETSLPGNLGAMSREERLALSNQRNQSYVNAHHDDSMETLVADVAAARQETLNLLELFTDEQLPRMRLSPLRLTGLPVICSLRTPSTRQYILCGLRKDFAKVSREILASQGVNVGMKGTSAFPVLSNCVDPPINQYRRALEDISLKNPPSHIQ
jgi:hypothetical protein